MQLRNAWQSDVLTALCLSVAMLLLASHASGAARPTLSADRLEILDWLDPERALRLVELAPPLSIDPDPSQVEMLIIYGAVYANNNRYKEVGEILGRLDVIAGTADAPATRAAHYLRAYLATLQARFPQAEKEFKLIDKTSAASDSERYRLWMFQGYLSRMLGQNEVALQALEKSSHFTVTMHDELRLLCTTLAVGRLYLDTGNFERASTEASIARNLASRLGEEGALADAWQLTADIASRQGNATADRKASLVALEHARRSGSSKWLSMTLVSLGDSYLESGDHATSLKYSQAALPIMLRRNDRVDIEATLFLQGLAYIGLGNVEKGQGLADGALKFTVAGGNLLAARDQLYMYEGALERAGYLTLALQVYHRYTEVSEQFMTSERQRAFLELSARFDDERKAAELELLRRDSVIRAAEARGQRLELDKVRAESFAARANANRSTVIRNVTIYAGLSLLLGVMLTAWTLRRRHDLVQTRIASAERLAALGRLTGGIAHEFNNQLTVLQQALGLLSRRPYLNTDPDSKALLEELRDSGLALADTTAQLQSFSRQQNLRPQSIPLAGFLQEKRIVLERTAGSSMSIELTSENPTLSVWADQRQLLAALINIVANARDAMSAQGPILIEVATQDLQTVRISVIDKGTGMDAETVSQATEPFFTTKSLGMGTGLGLSMVDGFARQSGGRLCVFSELGRGSKVSIILPGSTPLHDA
jgi:signal transduction histidine kinase